ncbi:hypothetical protein ACO0SA_002298 [Hanseniaspora valbyensis]
MNDTSLQLTQSITKLYSYLNTFNKQFNYETSNNQISLGNFFTNCCISEINNITNYFYKNNKEKLNIINNQLYLDLINSLLYWIESLLDYIKIKNNGTDKYIINVSKFIDNKNGRIDDLVIILDFISKIITLVTGLLKVTVDEDNKLYSEFEKNLFDILDLIKNTLEYSNTLETSKNKDDNMEFIKVYKSFVNLINRNWIGKLAAIAVVFLSNNENKIDIVIMNILFRYTFTLELNGAIQAQKNIKKHTFLYEEYLKKDTVTSKNIIYGNVQKVEEEKAGGGGIKCFRIVNMDKKKLVKAAFNEYNFMFRKLTDENNYIAFQYHLTTLSGTYSLENNKIFQYYQHVKSLQDFDRLIYLSLTKPSKFVNNNLLVMMNGATLDEKLNNPTNQLKTNIDNLSRTFLKNLIDMHIALFVFFETTLPKNNKDAKIKELLDVMYHNFTKLNINFVLHSHGKLLFAFIYEYCFFEFLKKLKTINASYVEFIHWDYLIENLNLLLHSFDYNNIAFVIGIIFSYWPYIPKNEKKKFLVELILKNWNDILSPEVRGFSLIDVLLAKLFIYKQLYSSNEEILEILVNLELKNQYNKDLKVSIEFPNDPLILPNFRKVLLFSYPDTKQKKKIKKYDIKSEELNQFSEKELPKINVKSLIANKELPNPMYNNNNTNNSNSQASKTQKGGGSMFNNFISDLSKTISQFTQPVEQSSSASNNALVKDSEKYTNNFEEISVNKDLLEEELERVQLGDENPQYFFKMTSLDAQLIKTYIDGDDDYNPLDISQDLKDAFKSMKSLLAVSKDKIEDPIIKKINYKAREIQVMNMSKKSLIETYNKTWNEKYNNSYKTNTQDIKNGPQHNTVVRSMDDSFISDDGDDIVNFSEMKQNDISSKIFRFIQDTNSQISDSLDWNSIAAAENQTALEEELNIPYDLKLKVMPKVIKSHLSKETSNGESSNNNVKKFIAVFNKTIQEYDLTKVLLNKDLNETEDNSKLVIINEFLRFHN